MILLSPVIEGDVYSLMMSGCPFVVVGNDYLNLDVPTVLSDDCSIAYNLTSKMIAEGHTDIALVCSQRLPLDRTIERGAGRMLRGYRSAVREHGLSGREIIVNFGSDKAGPSIVDMDNEQRKMLLQATAVIAAGSDLTCEVREFLQKACPGKRTALAAYVDEDNCAVPAETVDILVERSQREVNRNAAGKLMNMIGGTVPVAKCNLNHQALKS